MILLLLVAFLLEHVAFFSFAALANMLPVSGTLHVAVYVLLLAAVITFWSVYMAPRAPKKLRLRAYYVFKAIIYLIAAFVLVNVVGLATGAAFVILWVVDELLLFKLQHSGST